MSGWRVNRINEMQVHISYYVNPLLHACPDISILVTETPEKILT